MHPISPGLFKSLADDGKVKSLKEKYQSLIKDAPDKTYPFILIINNPTTRIRNKFLFIDNNNYDFVVVEY